MADNAPQSHEISVIERGLQCFHAHPMKQGHWKIAAITQSVVLLAILGCVLWWYPIFRGVRYHFFDRACAFGDDTGVAILLALGADPDGRNDYEQFVKYVAAIEPTMPLYHAARDGDSNVVRLLLQAHANPNPQPTPDDNLTPIAVAAMQGHAEAARLLRVAGARLDLPGGRSVIELARQHGHSNVVAVLQRSK
jgi:hypothetical protein